MSDRFEALKIHNCASFPEGFTQQISQGAKTLHLSGLAGSERLCVNIDVVPPGGVSTEFHAHSAQEEFFYILSGQGTLRTNQDEKTVTQGDFLAKPPDLDTPHQFINSGSVPLEILDISTVEQSDLCHYPDENAYLLRPDGLVLKDKKT